MPNRSEIQAFLIANGFEAQANDQASLVFAERLVEVLGEPTAEMIELGSAAIQAEGLVDVATAEGWKAMFAARFPPHDGRKG